MDTKKCTGDKRTTYRKEMRTAYNLLYETTPEQPEFTTITAFVETEPICTVCKKKECDSTSS